MTTPLIGQPKSTIDQLSEFLDGGGNPLVIDSRVVSKNSAEYWLLQLNGEGWKIVSRDTLPIELPNGMKAFSQIVHFERQVPLSEIAGDLRKIIDMSRMQAAMAKGVVPATSMPPDMPDIAALLAGRKAA